MSTVDTIIADHLARIDSNATEFQQFVSQLLDATTVFYENVVEDVLVNHVPLDVVTQMMDAIAVDFPAVPSINVPTFAVPAVPEVSFTTIEHSITVLEAARTLALTDLQEGGYGIDTDDETQLIDRFRDRAAADAQAAVDEVERLYATRRFSEPPGTLFGATDRAREAMREAVSVASRDVYIQRATQFVQARQFVMQVAPVLDRTRADIKEVQFRIEEARARYLLTLFTAQLDHFKTQLSGALDKATLTVRIYEAQAAVADARARVAAEKAKVFIGEYEANVRAFLGVMQVRLENAKNQLNAAASNAESRRDAAKAGTDVFGTIVAHALGGLNTMVSKSATEA